MKKKLSALCVLIAIFQGTLFCAQSTPGIPASFYRLRDAVYMQNSSAVEIIRLYTAAKADIDQTLSGAEYYSVLSRCAFLVGITFQTEGKKPEAIGSYIQGIAWAEDSLSINPTSEGYQYLAMNLALSCWVMPLSYAIANVDRIEENAQKALALNPHNLAARYVIAAKYIQAPWPVGNMKRGANLLREIVSQDLETLEKEDVFNIYLAMAVVCKKEKKNDDAAIWQTRALDLYPTNRFKETLLRQEQK
jgi:tetratricopeptide (TPR) repeat protein